MAYNPSTLYLFAFLFLATNSIGYAQILSLTGQVCCTSTGNCPGQALEGVNVILNCSNSTLGVSATVGQGTTNANGLFNITVPSIPNLLTEGLTILPCNASIQLPLPNTVCSVLSNTTGLLVSTVRTVGGLVTTAVGLVQNATTVGFGIVVTI